MDEDLAYNENWNDHRDVPLSHLYFLLEQGGVVFDILDFMGHLEFAIESNYIG